MSRQDSNKFLSDLAGFKPCGSEGDFKMNIKQDSESCEEGESNTEFIPEKEVIRFIIKEEEEECPLDHQAVERSETSSRSTETDVISFVIKEEEGADHHDTPDSGRKSTKGSTGGRRSQSYKLKVQTSKSQEPLPMGVKELISRHNGVLTAVNKELGTMEKKIKVYYKWQRRTVM
ncbi:hypothetical protein NDU88_006407 [Pleurodeles waltl]|uniref:Uncharacterized protein n=1 Tax=Pleurodeles waltl TaxID=8319 RepID=A0AAV7RRY1_PLEWA|nr:hypothetical protein NDU88_006407 [Pleurodeles waltl]